MLEDAENIENKFKTSSQAKVAVNSKLSFVSSSTVEP